MVSINIDQCTKCGICLTRFKGYCLHAKNGYPVIDYLICNQCQKCIAICPQQAFLMNGVSPQKITESIKIDPGLIKELLSRRRSIKKFLPQALPKEQLLEIANAAAYAPNQNKNIEIRIVDDKHLIEQIDQYALKFIRMLYRIMFPNRVVTALLSLLPFSLLPVKKKMDFDLLINRRIVKENTAALFLLVGDARIPVTEASAQYLLANMVIYSETLGIGSTLMDSLKMALNHTAAKKKLLRIQGKKKVLGVLAVGYSAEKIVNKPAGYEIPITWNV